MKPPHALSRILVLALVAGFAAAIAGAAAARPTRASQVVRSYSTGGSLPLRTALLDPQFQGGDSQTAFAMASATGATYVRLPVPWRVIAPATKPQGFVATDPTSPGYSWTGLDSIVEQADVAGLTPILDISTTPDWAYASAPNASDGGTPRAADLGDFAKALAQHYNGSAASVPAEHVFQLWNEPNVSIYLSPVSASAYRGMLNAVADAVRAVDPKNLVVAGDLDPFGHPKSTKQKWYSVAPLAFMRSLLCLSKGAHPHATGKTPAHFDVWSHHPYTFGGPFGHAKRGDDVSLGDLPKMRALLRTAVRMHRIVTSQPVQFWVTEFGWDTNAPRPHGVPLALDARWTSEALYQMWRSGVSLATWFLLQDQPSPSHFQSGLYFHSESLQQARAKPMRTAFRFPFVAYRGKGTVRIWGRDATSTTTRVTIQRRHGIHGGWRVVARIRTNRSGIFATTLGLNATSADWLRAAAPGSGNSLAFSLTVPKNQRYGPWGN
jgi:hypothetical protein